MHAPPPVAESMCMLSIQDTEVHWRAGAHATSRGEVSLRRRLLQGKGGDGKVGKGAMPDPVPPVMPETPDPSPSPVPNPSSSTSTSVSAV